MFTLNITFSLDEDASQRRQTSTSSDPDVQTEDVFRSADSIEDFYEDDPTTVAPPAPLPPTQPIGLPTIQEGTLPLSPYINILFIEITIISKGSLRVLIHE